MLLHELTPQHLRCVPASCPAVYKKEGDGDTLIIIGKKLSPELAKALEGKVGPDEYVIELSKDFFKEVPGL